MTFIQLCKSQSRLQLSHNHDFWSSLSWFVLFLIAFVQKALSNHTGVVECSVLISARLRDYCHLAFRCILPPPHTPSTLSGLLQKTSSSCRIIICVVSIMKKLVISLYILLFFFFFLQDLQIISTDENQVFVAVQEWYQTDTYNLYQSDPQGVYYSILLENVRSTKQPEENVLIDILEVGFSVFQCL